ncbi:unnamed protein product [Linum tenue]|uniref:Uncharacterized protein n=1 Tax=Linum tenue TaxID=586396 RepID=A0AAV0HCZ8_9ROSI|nr:unnamed protein product [Linum tenue]
MSVEVRCRRNDEKVMSWLRAGRNIVYNRQLCTATHRRRVEDEGDWFYSSEWWGTEPDGHTILRTDSDHGNGVVSVLGSGLSLFSTHLKSMAATGLSALACSDHDLAGVAFGKKKMRVLCIGHGGGSLPLFLASKLRVYLSHSQRLHPEQRHSMLGVEQF